MTLLSFIVTLSIGILGLIFGLLLTNYALMQKTGIEETDLAESQLNTLYRVLTPFMFSKNPSIKKTQLLLPGVAIVIFFSSLIAITVMKFFLV